MMDKVYQNTVYNIASSISSDSHGSLFRKRPHLVSPVKFDNHFELLDDRMFVREIEEATLQQVSISLCHNRASLIKQRALVLRNEFYHPGFYTLVENSSSGNATSFALAKRSLMVFQLTSSNLRDPKYSRWC